MTSQSDTRQQANECSICHELFTEPKILPCAHLLCRDCLVDWLHKGDASCPICRALITNTMDRSLENCKACADSLPTDLAMAAVTDSMNLLSKERLCEMCEVVDGESLCLTCRVTLCRSCVKLHGKLPLCRSHKVETLSSLTSERLAASQTVPCSVHTDKTSELFCSTHDKAICNLCFATNHRSCPDIIELVKMLERSKCLISELEEKLISSEAEFNESIEELDQILTQSEKNTAKAVQDIDDICNRLLLSVENCRQRLKAEVLAAESKLKAVVHDGKTALHFKRGTVVAHRQLIKRIQKTIPNSVLYPMASTLDVRIQNLDLEAVLPDEHEPIALATLTLDLLMFERFEQDLRELGTLAVVPASLKSQKLWGFHIHHGQNITLSNKVKAMRNISTYDNGIVMADKPMAFNKLFEIRVEKMSGKWISNVNIGLVADPVKLKMTNFASNLKSAIIIDDEDVVIFGEKRESDCGKLLPSITVGSRVGVLVDEEKCLHLYIDGIDQGIAARDVPQPCYALFDLIGKPYEITALPCTIIRNKIPGVKEKKEEHFKLPPVI